MTIIFKGKFLDLYIKIKNNKFQIGVFDNRDCFLFSIFRMPEKASSIPSNIFYMAGGAEYLRIDRACNNLNSFLNSINPLVGCMISQGAKKYTIAIVLLKIFSKL